MAKTVNVVLNNDSDEDVIQAIAAALRGNAGPARQLRDFAETLENDQPVHGLQFQPKPGQLLVCHFGLGFQPPEMVKTRPVLVLSPKVAQWSRLCLIVPISSKAPEPVMNHHYRLPDDTVPGNKYPESWVKGDMVTAVSCHRLDRFKVGFRQYVAPQVSAEVLKEARRCALHALGMHSLTVYW